MSDHYEPLDHLIVSAIKRRRNPLYDADVSAEAKIIGAAMGREPFRVVDGRLTALKKAGRIVFCSAAKARANGRIPGWSVV